MKTITIDAKDKSFGRVASEAAINLRGKNSPDFKPNVAPEVKVKITNLSKIKLTGNKMKDKTYKRYSGYPGGLKTIKFKDEFEKRPEQVFTKSVERMLPKNKLKKIIIKNLVFES